MIRTKNIGDNIVRRKNVILPRILIFLACVLVVFLLTFFTIKILNRFVYSDSSVNYLYSNWDKYNKLVEEQKYDESQEVLKNIYSACDKSISKNSCNAAARMFKGYTAFLLSESELNQEKVMEYIDTSIFNLRVALSNCNKKALPQIQYMLGKVYYYKNKISNYNFYYDLVIKYLNLAEENGFKTNDIDLLKGFSYYELGMYDLSLKSCTEALLTRNSDSLLLLIAKLYYVQNIYSVAKQYLFRVNECSEDEDILLSAKKLLAQIYLTEKEYDSAEKEFNSILEKNKNYTDAYYGLGVIYEERGDAVKARALWRQCLKIDRNYQGAIKKLAEK